MHERILFLADEVSEKRPRSAQSSPQKSRSLSRGWKHEALAEGNARKERGTRPFSSDRWGDFDRGRGRHRDARRCLATPLGAEAVSAAERVVRDRMPLSWWGRAAFLSSRDLQRRVPFAEGSRPGWRPTTPRRRRRGRRPRRTWGFSRRSASPRPGRSIDGATHLTSRGHVARTLAQAHARTPSHARGNLALRARTTVS